MARNKEMKIAIKIGGQVEATLKNAISQATRQIGAVSKAAVHTTKAMAAGTAAAAAAIGAASVKVGKEFETAMSSAAATADATPEQYKKMEEAARAMGRATSKTAAESAAALEYMALAGWDVDTSISALPSVLKMSEASGMELARTSDLITDSMSALGVSIEGLPGYLDVAAKAQNKSNQTAEQLMEAYLGVGGTMNNLSVPITESATALGVLANRGIKGSEAGTALNAVMVNLTTGTGQAGEMMGKLGISAFDSSGKFIGLENTLQQVNAALSGCTDEERNAALAAIGGKQHVDALNDLMAGLNTTNEKGITEWAALTKELEGCDGALEKMAARKMDNLEGDLAILNSAVSDLGISIYKDMNTPLRGAVQLGTQMADTLSKGYSTGGMGGMAASVGTALADAANAAAAAAPQMVDAGVGLMQNLINGVSQNSGALSAAAAQAVGSFVSGMGPIVPQMLLLSMDLMTGFLQGITAQVPQMGTSSAQAVASFADGFSQRLPEMIQTGLAFIQTVSSSLISNGPQLMAAAIQIVGTLATGFMAAVPQLSQMGVEMLNALASGITSGLPQLIPAAMTALMEFSGTLRTNVGQLVDAGLGMVMALAQSLIANIPVFVQTIPTIITNLCGIINDNAPKLVSTGLSLIVQLGAGLIQAIPVIIGSIPQIIQAIVSVVMAFNWLKLGGTVVTATKNGVTGAAKAIPGAFKDICGKAREALKNVDWKAGGAHVIRAIRSGIYDMVDAIPKVLKSIGKNAWEKIKSVDWKDLGIKIIKGIIGGIASTGKALWKIVKGLFTGKEVEVPASVETPKTEGRAASVTEKAEPAKAQAPIPEKASPAQVTEPITAQTPAGTIQASVKTPQTKTETPKIEAGPVKTGAVPQVKTKATDTAATKALETGVQKGTGKISLSNMRVDARTLNAAMENAGRRAAQKLKGTLQRGAGSAKVSLGRVKIDAKPLISSMRAAGRKGAAALNTEVTKGASRAVRTIKKLGTDMDRQMDVAWRRIQTQARAAMSALSAIVAQDAQRAADSIRRAFESMVIKIPEPRLPEIKVTRETVTYGNGRSQGHVEIPKFTTIWHAEGGIFKKPTLFDTESGVHGVGEAGAEAVLPLDALWAKLKEILDAGRPPILPDIPTLQVQAAAPERAAVGSSPDTPGMRTLRNIWERLEGILDDRDKPEGPSLIETLLEKLSSVGGQTKGGYPQQMQPAMEAGSGEAVLHIEYSPVYHLHGSASAEDVQKADKVNQKEFKRWFEKMWREHEKDLERTAFRRR